MDDINNWTRAGFTLLFLILFIVIARNIAEIIRLRRRNRVLEIDMLEKSIHEKVDDMPLIDLIDDSNSFHSRRNPTGSGEDGPL